MAYVRSGARGGTREGLTIVVLETKSSLGLDCRNTGCLYTSRVAHGPQSLR